MKEIEGTFSDVGQVTIGIVVAKFNDVVTKKLLEGALEVLRHHQVAEAALTVVWVPGSFEIPLLAQELAASGRYDAIICLGCVIKGATKHYDLVVDGVARGIADVSWKYRMPVIFEVLAADDIEIALDRAGRKLNRGSEAAESALEMVSLMRRLKSELS